MCLLHHTTRREEFRQGLVLPGSLSVCHHGCPAGAGSNIAWIGWWHSVLYKAAMGQDSGSQGVVCSRHTVLLLAVRLLWQHHHVRVVQQVRPQCLPRCHNCNCAGYSYLIVGGIHYLRYSGTLGTWDWHGWYWKCGQRRCRPGVHLLSWCYCQVQNSTTNLLGLVLPHAVRARHRLQHRNDLLLCDCYPRSFPEL